VIEVGPYRYTNQDARKTLIHAGDLFDLLERDTSPATIAPQRRALAEALAAKLNLDPSRGIDDLGIRAAKSFGLPGWEPNAVEGLLAELHRQWDRATAALRSGGAFALESFGTVAQLNTSGGGLPKTPRQAVDVTYQGVRGDSQSSREHHGRPWQALCIWNIESIASLQADGHPIYPGAAGENVTVTGLDWRAVRPGTRLLIGTVVADVWAYALPCRQQTGWFYDGDFSRLHHDNGDISRVYASVVRPGHIAVGDDAVLEPKSLKPRPPRPPVRVPAPEIGEPAVNQPAVEQPALLEDLVEPAQA
jgi:MOSC domain-containing protein YiiM